MARSLIPVLRDVRHTSTLSGQKTSKRNGRLYDLHLTETNDFSRYSFLHRHEER